MRRIIAATLVASALCLSGLGAAVHAEDVPTYVPITKPAEGTNILIVMPDVSLNILTAAGSQDPKEEWSQSARKNIDDSLLAAMKTRKYTTSSIDITTYEAPRAVQLVKLNAAVTDSIALNQVVLFKMPTKTSFDWTLGDGVSSLVPADAATPPAYALFVRAKGSYSSGGRAAMMVGMAMLGVGMPMGGQAIQASLVDLKTGQVVWYQYMAVPAGTDIREPAGATSAVYDLLKKLPL